MTRKLVYLSHSAGKDLSKTLGHEPELGEVKIILGGKGAGLATMTGTGLPVPPAFTITTAACVAYMKTGEFPSGMWEQTLEALEEIERRTGKRFGDPENMNVLPLLKTDFIEICTAMIKGELREKKLDVDKKSTVCKYVVPEGYGVKSKSGEKITVNEQPILESGAKLFYASVDKKIVTYLRHRLAL